MCAYVEEQCSQNWDTLLNFEFWSSILPTLSNLWLLYPSLLRLDILRAKKPLLKHLLVCITSQIYCLLKSYEIIEYKFNAVKYLPQNLAHSSALSPRPRSLSVGEAPAKKKKILIELQSARSQPLSVIVSPAVRSSLAHLVLPWMAAFMSGVNPRLFLASISILGHCLNRTFTTSTWPETQFNDPYQFW